MSKVPTTQTDPVTATVNDITHQIVVFTPAVAAGVIAAQTVTAAGADKKQAVIDGILAGAKVGETIPIPQVAAVAGLVDLVVSIFKALKVPGFGG